MMKLDYRELGVREIDDGMIEFEVTPEHVEEIRKGFVRWDGTYAVFPISETGTVALQIFLRTGKIRAAKFRAPKYTQDWKEFRPKKVKTNEDEDTVLDDTPGTEEAPD